ncbi:MAG: bifunctional acetaldehyde-CoA/alcohol dehydrogenase [Candidatus Onthovivens sp.]|nr:bifunctional acetaldehyde-CoA/alcohol dehydrogenase [Candidatus Onthovivens sp.]
MEEINTVQKEINELVDNGLKALDDYRLLDQEKIDYIVAKASVAILDNHEKLARHAVEETKRGVFEDKCTKNLFACEYVTNSIRHMKTVGIINDDPVTGITEIADPLGVICGITPVTNPTSTVIFKCLISLKTRNPIIFAFHPNAQQCSAETAEIIAKAAEAAGAPKNCIQWIKHPSMEATTALMQHKDVASILATGGNAMVKAAYSCGKPALGVGAGNVPAYVEKTANVAQAANDILMSKAFDNGMVCASEQAAIIDKEIYKEFVDSIKKYGAYLCNKEEKELLEKYMFRPNKDNTATVLFSDVVGHSAYDIAKAAGFSVPEKTPILLVECKDVCAEECLTREKLSPVLALVKANDSSDGISKAEKMVEQGGLGHSACIHTSNKNLVDEFGTRLKACRIIWNSPTTFGGIGNVYNSFLPSMTLGCGSYGHNSVSGNVSALNLINVKRIGKRRNNMQWFKVPSKIYFERNSIQYLKDAKKVDKAFIVADNSMVQLGFLQKVIDELAARRNKVTIQLFTDVEPDPDITTVKKGSDLMKSFQPDTIIALGGGSVMDAAKGMWLFYENPEVNFDDLKQKFMDIRKKAFRYPELGKKSKLICIPTTSGTGSEVTPFAVISNRAENKKYPLTDYSLTPTIAIIDPEFTTNLPSMVTADTGLDVLTHALEAYVSVLASDYTDALALQAILMVFEYLPRAVKNGKNDLEAREKMHNASTMAGMAFANAFLGMCHSMAHKVGGLFHVPHGRANAILLPYVIRYNGQIPQKLATWPKYNVYDANERYAKVARLLGLKASTTQEGVESLAKAVYELGKECGEKMCFKDQGIDEKEWLSKVEELSYSAYEDQCTPANPRIPLVKDMQQILVDAYYDNFLKNKVI